jgi:hypothetical protein
VYRERLRDRERLRPREPLRDRRRFSTLPLPSFLLTRGPLRRLSLSGERERDFERPPPTLVVVVVVVVGVVEAAAELPAAPPCPVLATERPNPSTVSFDVLSAIYNILINDIIICVN